MSVHTWSDDYSSGHADIDTQHKALFNLINRFEESNDKNVTNEVVQSFLSDMENICGNHFKDEEQLMREAMYPLAGYHADMHRKLTDTIKSFKKQLKSKKQHDLYSSIINLSTEWLNTHIIKDDLTFFSYSNNRNQDIGEHIEGRKCEVLTMNNEFISEGMIQTVEKSVILISCTSKIASKVQLSDIVKIVSETQDRSKQTFVATVCYSVSKTLKLFNATIVQKANKRKHFRVLTDLDASLRIEETKYPVKIIDISVGGIRIETSHNLPANETVTVEFYLQNNRFVVLCKIVRVLPETEEQYAYGLRFEVLKGPDSDKISSYVFNSQILARRQ